MNKLFNSSAIILCGGKSTRMGFDKVLIKIYEDYLLDTIIASLKKIFNQVILVVDKSEKIMNLKNIGDCTIIEDIYFECGPLGGIYTGLNVSNYDYNFVTACDMPIMNFNLIYDMYNKLENYDGVICEHNGFKEPLYSFYHKKVEKIFKMQLEFNQFKILRALDRIKLNTHSINESEFKVFQTNLNTKQDLELYYRGMSDSLAELKKLNIVRYESGKLFNTEDVTVEEYQTEIFINGKLFLSVMATPENLEDLAIGMLFSERIINSIEDVKECSVSKDLKKINIKTNGEIQSNKYVRISGFGGGMVSESFLTEWETLNRNMTIKCDKIVAYMDEFSSKSQIFQATGAVHSCCMHVNGKTIFADDVGRHNALDKVIGNCIKNNIDMKNGLILTTGRISTEILLKTARAGISILISKSPPTDRAVELANKIGMTLIGFARGERFNIYAGEQRVVNAK